jgi:hypothetical protein
MQKKRHRKSHAWPPLRPILRIFVVAYNSIKSLKMHENEHDHKHENDRKNE